MNDIAQQPRYDPDSRYWEIKAEEAKKTFDLLPISEDDWNRFVEWSGEYQKAVLKQKNTTELTWFEVELLHRLAAQVYEQTQDIDEIIRIVKRVLIEKYRIGDWNDETD